MRAIEALLVLADLLAFVGLTVALPPVIRGLYHLAPVALVIAGVQALIEGPRWQMVPAYGLAALLFLVWVWPHGTPVTPLLGPMKTGRIGYGLLIGLGVLGVGISIAAPLLVPIFRLPQPTGPHAIGTVTYHWIDWSRPELITAGPNDRREVMVQIWYPAKADPSAERVPYIQDVGAVTAALARVHPKLQFILASLKYVTGNATAAPPVADDEPSYPVLIFLEGLSGFRQMNTFQVEELVSHGYIVAAIDQPYLAAAVVFPDGRQATMPPLEEIQPLLRSSYMPTGRAPTLNGRPFEEDSFARYLAQDVSFTLDQLAALNQSRPNGLLTGRLDLQRAGAFGFSGGGIVAGEACLREPRLRACLVMDAPMPADAVEAGLRQPSMWITRDAETMRLERRRAGGWPEAEIHAHQTSMRAVFERLPGDGYFVQLPGTFHINFCDLALLSPMAARVGLSGPIDARRAHSIIRAYSLAFFNRHLRGLPARLLDGPAERYPEIRFESRRH